MSTYKIKFEQLRQHSEFSEVLSALERGFSEYAVDFFLIGAVAKDLWMTAINSIAPNRITRDIDFAVLVNDNGTYQSLKKYLIEYEGFQPVKDNAFVLLWKGRIQIDLLPFGNIADKDSKVSVEGVGLTSVNMPGFMEVYNAGLPNVELEGKHQFKFCTLPGIVILKLLAWEDRPEIRKDDIKDFGTLLQHFFSMYSEQIYEHHSDLFGSLDIDLKEVGARVMGREMKQISMRNPKLHNRLTTLFHENTQDMRTSKIALLLSQFFDNTVETNIKLLSAILTGLQE